ncbi:unnamed protein product [Bemisia tabaci]|uniref:PPM-type phosphatase domain-containing protein n=2 Tax=Bemisia tabaci TaxID=7038 RepID=A0A9P0AJF6_BEMTA|nr:PREDICTED: protein phosphatase 1L-like [Bemisia tabaci]CAH0393080.1 unnamed protein product [Bemisia tabaci]
MKASKAAKEDSGTTALIAILEGSQLIVANVGDSRGVMCDATGNAVPLSFDHKPNRGDEKERIEKEGGGVKFKNGKWMLDGWIEMLRTLGNRLDKFNGLIATPEVLTFYLSDYKPQFLVLATDGLYNVMRNDQIIAFIQARLDEEYYGAKSLVRYAYHHKGPKITSRSWW